MLLLSGDLDVATPTFRSQEVADALPNATLVVFPGRTHVQIAGSQHLRRPDHDAVRAGSDGDAGHKLREGGSRGGFRSAGWQH